MTFDLTHPLRTGMTVFPGDPTVEIQDAATIASDGVAVCSLHLGTHTGTHVDAPAHTEVGGRTIDRIAPEELTGEAVILHLPGLADDQPITRELLEKVWRYGLGNLSARIVLVATGWDRYWGTPRYLRHPVITVGAAEALADAGVHVLGTDTASPDAADDHTLPVHHQLLGADHLIVENLRGLSDLPGNVEFTALPLNIAGADGSPVRAMAKERGSEVNDRRD
jgi:kynurenine formamidase